MKNAVQFYAVTAFALLSAGTAFAADVTNNDATAHTLAITENGERSEIVVDPGQTVSICQQGCFMTAPNGDLMAVQGGDGISLVDGAAVVQ